MNDEKNRTEELIDQTVMELKKALQEESLDSKEKIDSTQNNVHAIPGGLPMSLSIETEGSLLTRVANIGDALPIKLIKVFSTGTDIPEALAVRLYAGERLFAKDNILVAELTLSEIRKLSGGRPIITVVINIDHDMNISIEVTDEGSLKTASKSVSRQWIPPQDEILRMIREANDNAAADAAKALKIRRVQMARESLCKAELNYKTIKNTLNPEKKSKCREYIRELKTKLKKIKSYDINDVAEKSLTDAVNKLNAIFSDE